MSMLLATLGKVLAVVAIGGGGVATYHFATKNSNPESYSSSTYSVRGNRLVSCTAPFLMKSKEGIEIPFYDKEGGQKWLEQYYQGQGTVIECPSYRASN